MFSTLKHKLTTTITGGAIIIAAFSLLSRLLGLVRDRLLFSIFGAGDVLDTYYAAFRLPDLVFNTLILGALSAAFVPVFLEYWHKDKDEAWRIANTVLNSTLIILFVFGILGFYFAPEVVQVIAPGFDLPKRIATAELTRIMLIGIMFLGVSNVASSILNAFKRFTAFALAPVLYNVGIIAGIFLFVPFFGVQGLAWGVVLGSFLHFFIQLPAIARLGFKYKLAFAWRNHGVRKIEKLMIPRTFSLIISQINQMINTIIGSTLAAGSVAIFNAANNLQSVPIGIFAIPLSLAYFPIFSEAWVKQDIPRLVRSFSEASRRMLFIAIPIMVFMILLRAHIVRLVLGAGEFDWNATIITARALSFFMLSLFAQCLIPLLARVFYSLQDTKTPVIIGSLSVLIDIVLSFPFARLFGIAGVALTFSIAGVVNVGLLWIWLRRRLGDLDDKRILRSVLIISALALVAGLALYAVLYAVAPVVNTRTTLGILIQTALAGIVGVGVYLGLARLLGMEEIAFRKKQ